MPCFGSAHMIRHPLTPLRSELSPGVAKTRTPVNSVAADPPLPWRAPFQALQNPTKPLGGLCVSCAPSLTQIPVVLTPQSTGIGELRRARAAHCRGIWLRRPSAVAHAPIHPEPSDSNPTGEIRSKSRSGPDRQIQIQRLRLKDTPSAWLLC